MTKVLSNEIKRFLSLKRFWIPTCLSLITFLVIIVVSSRSFFNDLLYTETVLTYEVYFYSFMVGLIIFICLYRKNFIKKLSESADEYNVKISTAVLCEWITGVCAIMVLYGIMIVLALLFGFVFGLNISALLVKAVILTSVMDMIAVTACYSVSLIFLFITPFPVLPIFVYSALAWIYPVCLDIFGKNGIRLHIYTDTREAFSAFMMHGTDWKFVPVFILYVIPSLLLSMLVFKIKKKRIK
ncbi:MAG: hypothetical protein K6G75_06510 [Lachnospiraceae bacterium]|nr:hypothetical protein [Lachnospiraceae bacterium]